MEKRNKKRIVIISIYLLIAASIAGGIYFSKKPEPTCFDGLQNGNEEGVDCGGSCLRVCSINATQDISVEKTGFIPGSSSARFDVYSEISNPNSFLGGKRFSYEFSLRDASGNIIAAKTGNSFILPGEKKYLIEHNLESETPPAEAMLNVKNVEWVEFQDYQEKPQLKIINRQYRETNSETVFSEAAGLLKNESPFDFNKIKVKVALKDGNGEIIALNSTEMNTVKSGEDREFKVVWPSRFPGSVSNMEFQSEVNVFESESFVKRNFREKELR